MHFTKQQVPYSVTNGFNKLFVDYINNNKNVSDFYSWYPNDNGLTNAINAINNTCYDRNSLVNVLEMQNNIYFNKYPNLQSQIKTLQNKNTYTVCTGHQICLFTGPLYFIYKIITTINLSRQLKIKYPDKNFVPIFWMASEDHDIEEINHFYVFGKKIKWDTIEKGAAGEISSKNTNDVYYQLSEILKDGAIADELKNIFESAYLKNNKLSDATRELVYQLFGNKGLVVLDPNVKSLKEKFKHKITDDILNNQNKAHIDSTNIRLRNVGYDTQINARDINFFYLKENCRERIVLNTDTKFYEILNTEIRFTKDEIKKDIDQNPEKYSPNVVMRPLYQQIILPNIAYIGGSAEIAYWLQLKEMFQKNECFFPVLFPRNSAIIFDNNLVKKIKKLKLNEIDLLKNENEIIGKFLAENNIKEVDLSVYKNSIEDLYKNIQMLVSKYEKTLGSTVDAELTKAIKGIENINTKLIRAIKQKNEISLSQIHNVKNALFPNGNMQERRDNFCEYYLKYGKMFFDELETMNPFEFSVNLLIDNS